MAVAYEVNKGSYFEGVPYRVVGTQIHEILDTESFVDTNTALTPTIRGSIQRKNSEVWVEAIDNAQLYYDQKRAEYFGLSFLSKLREMITLVTTPHSVEISLPVPGLAGLRRRLSTGS